VLDGIEIIGQPLDLWKAGNFSKVPVIIGTVRDELTSFIDGAVSSNFSSVEFEIAVTTVFPNHFMGILELYSPGDDPKDTFCQLMTDFFFLCPTWTAVQRISQSGVPVYWYQFLHPPSTDPLNTKYCVGKACHGAELHYVWEVVLPDFPFTPDEQILSSLMHDSWAKFIKTGFPPTDWKKAVPLSPEGLFPSMDFDIPTSLIYGYRQDKCQYWETLGYW